MGIAIPQVITPSKASGAQVIDGSLKFDETKSQNLKRTPGSAGNRKTHTLSCWVKRTKNTDGSAYFMILAAGSSQTNRSYVSFTDADKLQSANIVSGSVRDTIQTDSVLRNSGLGWYHLVVAIDSTQSTAEDRVKIYINGELQSDSGTDISQNAESFINSTNAHYIGETTQGAEYFDGHMSQFYLIDGQALTPNSFGFTDPLTNTWRPKKFTGAFTSDYTGVFAPYSAAARLSSFTTVGTLAEDATGYTLPMSNPSHYGGKALNGGSGGFYIDTVNSATEDFFMGCWIKIDTLVAGNQMAINITESYKYFELRSGGVIGIRHVGGSRADSSATSVADGNWHHIALSRYWKRDLSRSIKRGCKNSYSANSSNVFVWY